MALKRLDAPAPLNPGAVPGAGAGAGGPPTSTCPADVQISTVTAKPQKWPRSLYPIYIPSLSSFFSIYKKKRVTKLQDARSRTATGVLAVTNPKLHLPDVGCISYKRQEKKRATVSDGPS